MSMLATTHISPVVGVDVHTVIIPPSPSPIPIPHPHIGVVVDFRELVNGAKSFVGSIVMNFVQENVPEEFLAGAAALAGAAGQAQEIAGLASAISKGDFKSAAMQVGGKLWNSPQVQDNPLIKSAVGLTSSVKEALGAGAGQGGGSDRPVLVNNLMRATIGTNSRHIPGLHFPLGASFAPKIPSCDAEGFMGSKTVVANGDPFSHLAHPSLSCWFAGMMPTGKNAAHTQRKELSLPTAVTLPIPLGRPVLVGGPPTLNFLAIALALFKAFRGSALAKKLFKKLPSGFIKCTVLDAEPVNSITGEVVVQQNDFVVEGRLPLVWDRYYSGHQAFNGAIGHIWLTPADSYLSLVVNDGLLGAIVQFPDHKTAFEALPVYEGWAHRCYDWQQGHAIYRIGHELILRTRENIEYAYTLPEKWLEQAEFLTDGQEIKHYFHQMKALNGNGWRFERDKSGRLLKIVEFYTKGETGRWIECQYNNLNLSDITLYCQTENLKNESRLLVGYRQNALGDLTEVFDAHQLPYRFGYIDNHQMVRHTDRNGLSFYYDYTVYEDGISRVHHAWGDHGLFDYQFVYNLERRETLITDSLGHTTILQFDDRNLPLVRIDPLGGVKSYQYDSQMRGISEIDPGGNKTEWTYDERANITQRQYPDGSKVSVQYNEQNKAVFIKDAEGQYWTQAWDEKGNLVKQQNPLKFETHYIYDELGQLVQVESTKRSTQLTYDNLGFIHRLADSQGHETTFEYDGFGQLIARQLANGDKTVYQYDKKGRLLSIKLPDGRYISCLYDSADNLVEYHDAGRKITRFAYFGQGRLAKQSLPDGHNIEYHYDTEERLMGVTNQAGERWQLKRDAVGRLTEEVDYWGQSRKYQYDEAGYLTQSLNPLGQLLQVSCDKLGRIVSKVPENQPEKVEAYRYNKRGQLLSANNACCQVSREYNEIGLLIQETQKQAEVKGQIDYDYDLFGQLIKQSRLLQHQSQNQDTAFKQQIQFEYNELGQLIRQQIDDHQAIEFTFDEIGRLTEQKQNSHLSAQFSYTRAGQLKRQNIKKSDNSFSDYIEYHYDTSGNLVMRHDSQNGVDHYYYDVLGQIVKHSDPANKVQQYVYNASGNRFTEATTPEGERLLTFGDGVHYRLNEAGQLSVRQHKEQQGRFFWDENECLSRFYPTKSQDEYYEYRYDALRRRVSKTYYNKQNRAQKVTYFLWDGDALAGELAVDKAVETYHEMKLDSRFFVYYLNTFEPLILQCKQQGLGSLAPPEETGYYFYQNDPNGMPLRLYDEKGEIVWIARYSIFGRVNSLTVHQIEQPLRLQGQYFDDESGLHYNRHRYYDPITGIFISQDPIGLLGGFNPYQFAPNVLMWVDPLGLAGWEINGDRTTEILQGGPFNEKYYKDGKTGLWWSKDTAGHGESAFKVYKETSTSLEWIADADKDGQFMDDKHKGDTGKTIKKKDCKKISTK